MPSTAALIIRLNFVVNQDPNGNGQPNWPKYGDGALLRFTDDGPQVSTDDYRKEQIQYMMDNADAFHF